MILLHLGSGYCHVHVLEVGSSLFGRAPERKHCVLQHSVNEFGGGREGREKESKVRGTAEIFPCLGCIWRTLPPAHLPSFTSPHFTISV